MSSSLPGGQPVWDLTFDQDGGLDPAQGSTLLDGVQAGGVTDLFVVSHGWNSSAADARDLYGALLPMVADAAGGLGLAHPGFAQVFWPSLWFPPSPATPPSSAQAGQAGQATQAGGGALQDARSGTDQLTGKEITEALAAGFDDPVRQDALADLGALIDGAQGAAAPETEQARRELVGRIHDRLGALTSGVAVATEDAGETRLLLARDPVDAYTATARAFGTAAPAPATQGLGDWFKDAVNGAKDALRVFSYQEMKTRAGTVGQNGLGPLLARLHAAAPGVRVHLVGHSFGARLVSYALAGVGGPADSPVGSLTLLQGAFSHWAFAGAQGNPFGRPGGLVGLADRVHGPLVATFTPFDWAVGVWYPKASFLARQDVQADVTASRWGGMGSDAFQGVDPVSGVVLTADGPDTALVPGRFHRVDARAVIAATAGQPFAGAHSDIRHPAVAMLVAGAAAAAGS